MRFVLISHKPSRSVHLPAKSLKCIEIFTAFGHIYHPAGLNTTLLSKAMSFRQLLAVVKASQMHIPRTGEGEEPLIA